MKAKQQHTILWTEDDPDDLQIVRDVVREAGPEFTVVEAQNGEKALKYLQSTESGSPLPCLIVLDMNMPVLCGRKTLAKLKEQDAFKDIPVVMFTTSNNPIDRMFCQRFQVEMFTKPSSYAEFKAAILELLNHCGCQDQPRSEERA